VNHISFWVIAKGEVLKQSDYTILKIDILHLPLADSEQAAQFRRLPRSARNDR
jgi:hypothetical protein